jgi:hypothetical protein
LRVIELWLPALASLGRKPSGEFVVPHPTARCIARATAGRWKRMRQSNPHTRRGRFGTATGAPRHVLTAPDRILWIRLNTKFGSAFLIRAFLIRHCSGRIRKQEEFTVRRRTCLDRNQTTTARYEAQKDCRRNDAMRRLPPAAMRRPFRQPVPYPSWDRELF